jgi:O-antigen ligase
LGTALVSIVYTLVLGATGFEKHALFVLVVLPFLVVSLFNTDIIICAAIVLLFAKAYALFFSIVVLASVPVAVSYFITLKADSSKKVPTPIIIPLSIYIATMLPSFLNMHSYSASLLNLLNFASMIVMLFVVGNYVTSYKQIKTYSLIFLAFSLFNGFNVIVEGLLTKERIFGFAGVVFVDFVCIAILVSVVTAFYIRKSKAVIFIFFGLFLFVSLLFTQTRSILISFVFSLVFLLSFLFMNSVKFSIDKRKLLLQVAAITAILIFTFMILVMFVPEIFGRINEVLSSKPQKNFDGPLVSNTLISRFLIWHTSISAFLHHPVIGIGAYSFRFDSQLYKTIPIFLYKKWVQGLSPHITYLAVLTETGIIGLIGFMIFIASVVKMDLKSVKLSQSEKQKYYSLGLLVIQIYIFLSMCVTDAWLWGQCGMLWSIVLGLSIANYKIVVRAGTSIGNN